jgi:hypothetical protein
MAHCEKLLSNFFYQSGFPQKYCLNSNPPIDISKTTDHYQSIYRA